MLEAILSGITLGFVLALLVGPVFFLLIDTSIKKGFRKAVFLAAGVMLSDAFYILITYFSSTTLGFMQTYQTEIGYAGGLLLVLFGIVTIFKKPHIRAADIDLPDDSRTVLVDVLKGFMLNLLNPFVLIFWLGVSGTVTSGHKFSYTHTVIFFSFVLLTVLGTDILKAWLAARLNAFLKPSLLLWVNRVSGAGLLLFGLRMIWKMA
ncbi:MAG: LysE family translocator [Bacteroidia bacterium]|nr:LysE family translocator [Bacteroidia bacterium]